MGVWTQVKSLFVTSTPPEIDSVRRHERTPSPTIEQDPLLPPEILAIIFNFSCRPYADTDSREVMTARCATLARFSRISSGWRQWAQARLFLHPFIDTDAGAHSFFDVLDKRRDLAEVCRSLHWWGRVMVSGQRTLPRVLLLSTRIEILYLKDVKMDCSDLTCEKSLRRLYLTGCLVRTFTVGGLDERSTQLFPSITQLLVTRCTILGPHSRIFFSPIFFPSVNYLLFCPVTIVPETIHNHQLGPSFDPNIRFLADVSENNYPYFPQYPNIEAIQIFVCPMGSHRFWHNVPESSQPLHIQLEVDARWPEEDSLKGYEIVLAGLERWLDEGVRMSKITLPRVHSRRMLEMAEQVSNMGMRHGVPVVTRRRHELTFLDVCAAL